MAKVIIFLDNGRTSEGSIRRKIELSVAGHNVVMSNGSMNKGFEDSCDAIVLCCKNDAIVRWAKKSGIDIEFLGVEEQTVESAVDVTPEESEDDDSVIEVSYEEETKEESEEKKLHEVPPSIVAGIYSDPLGNEFEHKGRGYKKELRSAIEKFGVDEIKFIKDLEA